MLFRSSRVASELMESIATEYGWPDFRGKERTLAKVEPAVLQAYVGMYDLTPKNVLTFTLEGDQLYGKMNDQETRPVFPESETRFFLKVLDVEIDFVKYDKGEVTGLVLHQNGRDVKGVKRK